MSMEKTTYVILGYDLANHKTEKYDDWRWSEEWEEYTCSQINGEVQLFDDDNDKLFLGYVLAMSEEYEHIDPIQYSIHNFNKIEGRVIEKISRLQEIGVIEDTGKFNLEYKLIIFDVFI